MPDDMDQLGMFTPQVLGRALRDAGMERAAIAQQLFDPEWDKIVDAAIKRIARRQPTVHVDDLDREGVPEAPHFNAMGSVWRRAILMHVIKPSGDWLPCTVDPAKHMREARVYTSCLYDLHHQDG